MARSWRTALKVVVPAAAVALAGPPAAHAAGPLPMYAAALNAGTLRTGIGPTGAVGFGMTGLYPPAGVAPQYAGTEAVAGVEVEARDVDGGPEAHAMAGASVWAALLGAGTVTTGIGPDHRVGAGIVGAVPGA